MGRVQSHRRRTDFIQAGVAVIRAATLGIALTRTLDKRVVIRGVRVGLVNLDRTVIEVANADVRRRLILIELHGKDVVRWIRLRKPLIEAAFAARTRREHTVIEGGVVVAVLKYERGFPAIGLKPEFRGEASGDVHPCLVDERSNLVVLVAWNNRYYRTR